MTWRALPHKALAVGSDKKKSQITDSDRGRSFVKVHRQVNVKILPRNSDVLDPTDNLIYNLRLCEGFVDILKLIK